MCPIPNRFRDRAISLNRSLNLAPNIVLHSRHTTTTTTTTTNNNNNNNNKLQLGRHPVAVIILHVYKI